MKDEPMPYANDPTGLRRWHHARGLPWGPKFLGPDPIVIRRMSRKVMQNITVHLGNEHRVDASMVPHELHHVRHMQAHLYGEFRDGQAHYHERPKER